MASVEDTPMLPDPPDGKEASPNLHASFRDKLLAGKDREQLHGEWLVVSRSRKPSAQKGKGKTKNNSSVSKGQQERDKNANKFSSLVNISETQETSKENVVFSAKPTFSSRPNKLGKKRSRVEIKSTPVGKGSSSAETDDKQKIVADQARASNKSNGKGISTDKTTGMPNSSTIFKYASTRNNSMFDFGIKTAMNVDIIEPNRLRFKEDEELQKSLDEKLGVFL
ncbi:hypothetical protein SESBI_43262 [Sesbania bispinosa]|nr:hypothetical protein SESBI_43262 [Sesbania bispinosa]